ncbi:hypothetical protein GCM10027445_39050 [Amycolatopsis endophytica]|uniref:CDP-Glycerol:Poly(Glycerophosphate) glycerophosphotransferase n=1 Tax=Amycolatopsis endophytica TaxID=860233 RepID=A0A853B035_9PSEU|nr:hypothetical protein [Amycolatopsis endophytica]NYI88269.1 hypothetical protein [Amycolatopsis endophytica]
MTPAATSFFTKVPVDERYDDWLTYPVRRRVLVVVRTVTTLTRLLDVLSLLRTDHRVQVVFTHDPHRTAIFGAGVPEALHRLGAPVVPWDQAVATPFDLALAASENDELHRLDAPVLLFAHGIGFQKYYPGGTVVAGMNPRRLVRNGRVVPAAVVLSHADQLEQLRRACPPAAERGVVVGDPTHDRLLASTHRAPRYRRELGSGDRMPVLLASTWGPGSLIGADPDLPARLTSELDVDLFQVTVVLHPGIWAHGTWQVRAWLDRPGLTVLPPERGWQAALVGARCVITDEGSLALYAASVRAPLLLGGTRAATTVPGSPLAELAAAAPRLPAGSPRHAIETVANDFSGIAQRAVDLPGKCAETLRRLLYDHLRLPEPDTAAAFPAADTPEPSTRPVTAFVAGGRPGEVMRFPASVPRHPLPGQHVVAHETDAELAELDGAAIVYNDLAGTGEFGHWAGTVLRRWPAARLAAARDGDRCLVRTHDGDDFTLRATGCGDPVLLASVAYLRLLHGLPVAGHYRVRQGDREITVVAGS